MFSMATGQYHYMLQCLSFADDLRKLRKAKLKF